MTDHDLLWTAIQNRNLKAVSELLRKADIRVRLGLEARDEPRDSGYSNFDPETNIRKTGEL